MFRRDPVKSLCFRTDGVYCEMISGKGYADPGGGGYGVEGFKV